MVEVRQSRLDQAGEGLFAKTDLPSRTIVALFAGVRLKTATVAARFSFYKYYLCHICFTLYQGAASQRLQDRPQC